MPKGKNKRSNWVNEKWILVKLVELRAKTDSYLIADDSKDKKSKGTKKFVLKRKHKFENYKNCLEETLLENKISYL